MILIDDRYRLEDYNLRALDIYDDPVSYNFSNLTLNIPNRPGRHHVKSEIEGRRIVIHCKLLSEGHKDIDSQLMEFNDLFFDGDGYPKEVKLELEHWRGKYVNAILSTPISSARKRLNTDVVLTFECYDPYKYSNIFADEVTWGNEEITFEADYTLGHTGSPGEVQITGSKTVDVFVDGLNVYPIIHINGSATSLILKINGQDGEVNLGSFTDTEWKIERFYAWRNGTETFIDARNFKLSKGNNSLLILGSGIDIELSMKYRDRYK